MKTTPTTHGSAIVVQWAEAHMHAHECMNDFSQLAQHVVTTLQKCGGYVKAA